MRETRNLEFKENLTNNFLKTVSAYANYGTGEILFGVTDDAIEKGIENPKKACLEIENRINDNIQPVPEYVLSINEKNSVITLKVMEGLHKPYLYKAKAYRRSDSATIPVDRVELTRLILEGQDSSYEELAAGNQDLTFELLEEKLREVIHIASVSRDTLKTLELYSDEIGYNKAAELIADKNDFCGIDLARFGDSVSIILDRETYDGISIIEMYDRALLMYRKYYQYEQINGSIRENVSLIPEAAFREAIANAIVHRTWDVDAYINVSMFPDRIEITSPGGLAGGISREEYLRGGISVLRNRIIGNVFFRLHLIERFGTGIKRINEQYGKGSRKPVFEVTECSIQIILPVIYGDDKLSDDENKVYMLIKGREMSSSAVAKASGFGKSKTHEILKRLVKMGYIKVYGSGRGTKYTV